MDQLPGGMFPERQPASSRREAFFDDERPMGPRQPSLTLHDVALVMREQDAELLESIHFSGPNATGMTPLLMNQCASTGDIPDFALDDTTSSSNSSRARSSVSIKLDYSESGTVGDGESSRRRALSGEVWSRLEPMDNITERIVVVDNGGGGGGASGDL